MGPDVPDDLAGAPEEFLLYRRGWLMGQRFEREACAKLAEGFEMETGPFSTKQKRLIAAAIRGRCVKR